MKVYAVFEESAHDDLYERDGDGKCLVALYAKETDAMARMREEAKRELDTFDPKTDTKNESPWKIDIDEWTERIDSQGNKKLEQDCYWCWTIEEREVL